MNIKNQRLKQNYLDYEYQLNFMEDWTEELRAFINSNDFPENDIRKDYFNVSLTNTYHFYMSYMTLVNSSLSIHGDLNISDRIEYKFRKQFVRLAQIAYYPKHRKAHFNTINSRVFITAWSLFELAISTFYEAVVESAEIEKQVSKMYLEVKRCVNIVDGKEEKLRKILINTNPKFIPIPRKYIYLINRCNGYSRNKKHDQNFLEFFGKLRNTMHSNFIYYGNDYSYNFGHARFIFKNGEEVKWSDPFDIHRDVNSVKLYFYLIRNLNNIVAEIFKCIPWKHFVPYPDLSTE